MYIFFFNNDCTFYASHSEFKNGLFQIYVFKNIILNLSTKYKLCYYYYFFLMKHFFLLHFIII